MEKKERFKHNYTSELELKCLLIRIKNKRLKLQKSEKENYKINKYVRTFVKLTNKSYNTRELKDKRAALRDKLKSKAIELSLLTAVDMETYNDFGKIILLMIKNILKQPKFSGYTYADDFYSDAVHKIIKYLHNFEYTKISRTTGTEVNAFAYISQIIHNSIIHIIIQKNKQQDCIKQYIHDTISDCSINVEEYEINNESTYRKVQKSQEFVIVNITDTLIKELELLEADFIEESSVNIIYPHKYKISFKEYDLIKSFSEKHKKNNINITRAKRTENC